MKKIFFFNDTATTEIYTLPLHDALPNCRDRAHRHPRARRQCLEQHVARAELGAAAPGRRMQARRGDRPRSEEHTSELQSRQYLVCRLLLEKKTCDRLLRHLPDIRSAHVC